MKSLGYIEVQTNGVIVIDYQDSTLGVDGQVHFTPSAAGGEIAWTCSGHRNFDTNKKYLPANCR